MDAVLEGVLRLHWERSTRQLDDCCRPDAGIKTLKVAALVTYNISHRLLRLLISEATEC